MLEQFCIENLKSYISDIDKTNTARIISEQINGASIDLSAEKKELKEIETKIENGVNLNINADKTVIATGGSAVYCDEAMRHLKSIGIVVYLKVPYSEIEKRITNFSTRGIVIKSGNSLIDLYNERVPLYEKYADITVECNNNDLTKNVLAISDALKVKFS